MKIKKSLWKLLYHDLMHALTVKDEETRGKVLANAVKLMQTITIQSILGASSEDKSAQ